MKSVSFIAALLCTTSFAYAMEPEKALRDFALSAASQFSRNETLLDLIRAQNLETKGLTEAQIISLDSAWRAEVGHSDTPTISKVTENAGSAYLSAEVDKSEGQIVEVFAMDARGLNVAASSVTSDYWQGDEAKFQKTFNVGPNAVHVSEIELDESTQMYLAQVSVVIVDPSTQMPIGALTIGVNAENF